MNLNSLQEFFGGRSMHNCCIFYLFRMARSVKSIHNILSTLLVNSTAGVKNQAKPFKANHKLNVFMVFTPGMIKAHRCDFKKIAELSDNTTNSYDTA